MPPPTLPRGVPTTISVGESAARGFAPPAAPPDIISNAATRALCLMRRILADRRGAVPCVRALTERRSLQAHYDSRR